ncbi:MAG: DNA repair protein RecO [Bdellovibrionales bacterium]
MEWTDEAIVLSARAHGEHGAIVNLLTPQHGRYAGMMAGGQGARARPVLQQGNRVKAVWRARLAEHLGSLALDLSQSLAAAWLDEPEVLAIIASACAVTEASLPERQPMPGVYGGLCALFSLQDKELWAPVYVKWEIGLLQALGFGLDLSRCAATGETDDLIYVSPRTGRAVSRDAGEPYKDKLLPLPAFLLGGGVGGREDIRQGLDLTGFFLSRHVFSHPHSRLLIAVSGDLPQARHRMAAFYASETAQDEPSYRRGDLQV